MPARALARQVYGLEVSFAYHEFGGSGIISFSPKAALGHTFRESVVMGATALSRAQLAQLLRELQPQWPAAEYDLLRRNCCTCARARERQAWRYPRAAPRVG